MNFQFAIIFGYNYEGESAETLRLFESMDQLESIIDDTVKGWCDYYMIGEIKSNGELKFSKRVDI